MFKLDLNFSNSDAWFLSTTNKKGVGESVDDTRLVYPNVWGAMNHQRVITDADDIDLLKAEMTDTLVR